MRPLAPILMLSLLPVPALGSDGVVEIGQTCATQSGCLPGDAPGFPVSLAASGSYVLTSDLTVSDPAADALFVSASPMTLDLHGFQIAGPVTCSGFGSGVGCDPGTGRGIRAEGFARITVLEGSVRGFGSDGVLVAGRSRIDGVVVEANGGRGLVVGNDSVVTRSRARRNAGRGIQTGQSTSVRDCTAASNGSTGILTGAASIVSNTTGRDNGGSGISIGTGGTLRSSSAFENESDGFTVGVRANLYGSSSSLNGRDGVSASTGSRIADNTITDNEEDGIDALGRTLLSGNKIESNGGSGVGFGIRSSTVGGDVYRDNVIDEAVSATTGTVDGAIDAGGNVCNGSLTCP